MRTFHLPSFANQKLKLTFGKLALSAILLSYGPGIFAQNVGINTQQPDPSSALDIVGTDKGLLIPRVSLQSLTDNVTIPNPATALLVYNTNAGLGKVGFYYNSGTAASPVWAGLVGGELTLPYDKTASHTGALFGIENSNATPTSSAITAYSVSAMGLRGISQSGKAVSGQALTNGVGVFASAANTNGKALEVSGPMKIAGPGQSPGNGKVLMSDAVGNATWENISGDVAFRASGVQGGGSEVIAGTAVPVKVAFANQNYDLGDNYNDVNASPHSTFIAPLSGMYHFDAQITIFNSYSENSAPLPYDHSMRLIRVRNGNTSVIAQSEGYILHKLSSLISTDVPLLPDDQVYIDIAMTTGGKAGEIKISPELSYFGGRLVFRQ